MTCWPATIAEAAADRDSSSWIIAGHAARGLACAAAEGEAALRAAIQQLLVGQPSMAALRNLANAAAWAWTGSAGAEGHKGHGSGATAAAREIAAFVTRGDAAAHAIAAQAAALLREGHARRAVTISASSAVAAALAAWHGAALLLESRPRCEGRRLAHRLAAAGIPVTLAVDAAARAVLAPGDAVLLGADSVTPDGVSNKIGSWALAAAARERRVPVYVLAGPEKWWPAPLPDREAPADAPAGGRDPREVLPEPIPGVEVRNPYFETVPVALLTAFITAAGPQAPQEVQATLAQWRIHPWLEAG